MQLSALLTTAVALAVANAAAVDTHLPRQEDTSKPGGYTEDNNADIYPSPMANGGKWSDAYEKASNIVGQMSVKEKAELITSVSGPCVGNSPGVERLGIPKICLMDGPTGPRPVHGVSQFPAGVTTAATWDRDLMYKRSKHMGQEFFDQGVNIALAPVASGPIGRSPLAGRNWEGSFPDPYANGRYAYESVTGLQDSHVAATTKHFIAYEQETFRHPYNTSAPDDIVEVGEQQPISSNVDDYTTHTLYLGPFAEAVRAGSGYMMCSYNEINGTHACNDPYTQNHLLKTELNFQGATQSDWGGVHLSKESIETIEVSTPGTDPSYKMGTFWSDLDELVNNGTVAEDRVTDAAIRFLLPYYWLGQDEEHVPPEVIFNGNDGYDAPDGYRNVRKPETRETIRMIGTESITLLKNAEGEMGLPLNKPQRLALIGSDLGDNMIGDGCPPNGNGCPEGNFNGTLTDGGGSGYAIPPYTVTPLDAIKKRAIEDGIEVSYAMTDDNEVINEISSRADAALVFIKNHATEEEDRHDIDLTQDQISMLDAAVNASSNVIIVMHVPGVVNIEKWADNENVTAIASAWYPGQESGNAVVPILFGDESPSGKLPITWGKTLDDYPPNTISHDDSSSPQAEFSEGVYIDYRWFDKQGIEPRYEFGFGLSYTTFECSDIKIADNYKKDDKAIQETAEPFEGFDGSNSLYDMIKTVTATVTNTGEREGSEVAQLYVTLPGEDMPVRELKGFEKVKGLKAGESREVTFDLRLKDLSVWDVVKGTWVYPEGEYTFAVGNSSRNLPLSTTATH